MFHNVIRPSILGIFLNKYSKIEFDNKYLYLFVKNKQEESFSWRDSTGFVKINSGIFNSSIEFTFDSTHLKINFLKKSDCENSFNIINELLKNIIDERIISKKNILNKYTLLEYLRDSNVAMIENELLPLFNSYNKQREYWDKSLSIESFKFLNGY